MKGMFRLFQFLYTGAPLIVLPCIAYVSNDWYILLGIGFCYLGTFLATNKPIIFYISILFCFAYWFQEGFDIHQYVTIFFFCIFSGFIFFHLAEFFRKSYRQKVKTIYKGLADKTRASQLIDTLVEQYKKDNNLEEVTPKIIEEIEAKVHKVHFKDNIGKY